MPVLNYGEAKDSQPIKSTPHLIFKILARQESQIRLRLCPRRRGRSLGMAQCSLCKEQLLITIGMTIPPAGIYYPEGFTLAYQPHKQTGPVLNQSV